MAKISAHGAHEVARRTKMVELATVLGEEQPTKVKMTLVLTSDGRILRKFGTTGSYGVRFRFSKTRSDEFKLAKFNLYADQLGYDPIND